MSQASTTSIYALYILLLPEYASASEVPEIQESDITVLRDAKDLSEFSFFMKPQITSFLDFFSKTVVRKSKLTQGRMVVVNEDKYAFNMYRSMTSDRLVGVAVTRQDYPDRAARSVLMKLLDSFTERVPESSYPDPASITFPAIHEMLRKYQNPKEADAIMKLQDELDETKDILHKTIQGVLERGETLDQLVEKSQNLSGTSKQFYKTAKKQNSCCVVM